MLFKALFPEPETEKNMANSTMDVEKQYSPEAPHGELTTSEKEALSKEFYGIQKVVLMKKLGKKWDKMLVITG